MKGYTLLELMIATAIIGILAVVATNLFFSVSRGGSKVNVTAEVNQNGEVALGTLERLIRNAYSVSSACGGEAASSLTVVDRYGRNIVFSCQNVGEDTGYIASNSARITTENVAVSACAFTCTPDSDGFKPPIIGIDFSLRQASSNAIQGQTESQQFSTSVSLRNY